jgi:hypothetical protein
MTPESRKLWFAGNIDTYWVRWCLQKTRQKAPSLESGDEWPKP